jgi:hypothetical protein
MIVANPTLPLHPLHFIKCHPERSEGSAFDFSPACASPNVDALDAASRVSPLSATLTKNTRGGGTSQASVKNSNRTPSAFNFQRSTFNGLSARVRININPRHLRLLCFHTVTHSFAPSKMLSPIVSYLSTLFTQNIGRGVASQPQAAQSLDDQPPSRLVSLPPYFITSLLRLASVPLKPLPQMAHLYTCTCKKGPAAREPRYSPCAAS